MNRQDHQATSVTMPTRQERAIWTRSTEHLYQSLLWSASEKMSKANGWNGSLIDHSLNHNMIKLGANTS